METRPDCILAESGVLCWFHSCKPESMVIRGQLCIESVEVGDEDVSCVCLFVSDTDAPCGHHNKARIKMQREVRPFLCNPKPGNPFKFKWISVKLIKRRCNALVLCSLENNLLVINSSGSGRNSLHACLRFLALFISSLACSPPKPRKPTKYALNQILIPQKPEMMRGCKGCFETRGHSRDDLHLRGAPPRGFTPKLALQISNVSRTYSYT